MEGDLFVINKSYQANYTIFQSELNKWNYKTGWNEFHDEVYLSLNGTVGTEYKFQAIETGSTKSISLDTSSILVSLSIGTIISIRLKKKKRNL